MDEVSLTSLKKMSSDEIEKQLPLCIQVDGVPRFVLGSITGVVVIQDLHIRVRNQLRAQEKRARAGMPKPKRIDW